MKRFIPLPPEVQEVRNEFRDLFDRCAVCDTKGTDFNPLVVHEMTDGENRTKSLDQLPALLVVCKLCNEGPLKDRTIWPLERQCALKLVTDPARFDLATICWILGTDYRPTPRAVELADVAKHLRLK